MRGSSRGKQAPSPPTPLPQGERGDLWNSLSLPRRRTRLTSRKAPKPGALFSPFSGSDSPFAGNYSWETQGESSVRGAIDVESGTGANTRAPDGIARMRPRFEFSPPIPGRPRRRRVCGPRPPTRPPRVRNVPANPRQPNRNRRRLPGGLLRPRPPGAHAEAGPQYRPVAAWRGPARRDETPGSNRSAENARNVSGQTRTGGGGRTRPRFLGGHRRGTCANDAAAPRGAAAVRPERPIALAGGRVVGVGERHGHEAVGEGPRSIGDTIEAPRHRARRRCVVGRDRGASPRVGPRTAFARNRKAGRRIFDPASRRFRNGENSGGGSHAFIPIQRVQGVARCWPARAGADRRRADVRGRAGRDPAEKKVDRRERQPPPRGGREARRGEGRDDVEGELYGRVSGHVARVGGVLGGREDAAHRRHERRNHGPDISWRRASMAMEVQRRRDRTQRSLSPRTRRRSTRRPSTAFASSMPPGARRRPASKRRTATRPRLASSRTRRSPRTSPSSQIVFGNPRGYFVKSWAEGKLADTIGTIETSTVAKDAQAGGRGGRAVGGRSEVAAARS